mmetsp:Transcript_13546/g.29446  ORF Transcript_13546/g.29446 Transcript_13546/m.29446 type:complete len:93 (-) Transcript_13546:95-373(-)
MDAMRSPIYLVGPIAIAGACIIIAIVGGRFATFRYGDDTMAFMDESLAYSTTEKSRSSEYSNCEAVSNRYLGEDDDAMNRPQQNTQMIATGG